MKTYEQINTERSLINAEICEKIARDRNKWNKFESSLYLIRSIKRLVEDAGHEFDADMAHAVRSIAQYKCAGFNASACEKACIKAEWIEKKLSEDVYDV
jgi:hypothetical protein